MHERTVENFVNRSTAVIESLTNIPMPERGTKASTAASLTCCSPVAVIRNAARTIRSATLRASFC